LALRIIFSQPEKYADAPHALGLLRPGSKRPRRRCTAEKFDEFASPHRRLEA
jgi:hypothetical protein